MLYVLQQRPTRTMIRNMQIRKNVSKLSNDQKMPTSQYSVLQHPQLKYGRIRRKMNDERWNENLNWNTPNEHHLHDKHWPRRSSNLVDEAEKYYLGLDFSFCRSQFLKFNKTDGIFISDADPCNKLVLKPRISIKLTRAFRSHLTTEK